MLTRVAAGPFSIQGVSVGGVYTSLHVPELDVVLDVGIAPRSFVGAGTVLISHGHADHVGALSSLIGLRGLAHLPAPSVILPAEIHAEVALAMDAFGRIQRRPLAIPWQPLLPGQDCALYGDLYVRAFRTLHSVPSLGYALMRKVQKLKDEYLGLERAEIVRRKREGGELFRTEERVELAYATDTLIDVLDENPWLYGARVLVLECTFLDDRKPVAEARDKKHVHLDEVIARADRFSSEALVLMHFSQGYRPREVHEILDARLPAELRAKVVPFAPLHGAWPG